MGYVLLDQPNPHGNHFYSTRRKPLLAVVVHITGGLEDFDGDDESAEATARYAATTSRPVSWHSGSDTDSAFDLLPASYTAWHCQGYNASTYGHEISKRTPDWRGMDPVWVDRTLRQAAEHLGPKALALGIPLVKCTRARLDQAIAAGGPPVGFIGHWELDPGRRADPGLVRGVGDTFPWAQFLGLMWATHTPPIGDDDMALVPSWAKTDTHGRPWFYVLRTKGEFPVVRAYNGAPLNVDWPWDHVYVDPPFDTIAEATLSRTDVPTGLAGDALAVVEYETRVGVACADGGFIDVAKAP